MKKILITTIVFLFPFFGTLEVRAGKITNQLIESLKPAVVSITTSQTLSAYGMPKTEEGTGFVAEKEKGIIITNRHIASVDAPSSYEATFYDGSTAGLQLIWNDPVHDFAFLKVNPEKIPRNVPYIRFSRTAKVGQNVFMIGNNEGFGYSVQYGVLNDLYSFIFVDVKDQVFSMSLNSRGGSSGSPVFNDDGQVIGLNFASSETTASSVPMAYIHDALQSLLKEKIPARYVTNAIFDTINLDHAKEYYQYQESTLKGNIPGSRNRLLKVRSTLSLPLQQILEPGDIIEKVNEVEVGPNLYLLEEQVNQSEGKSVKFTVYREGKRLILDVPTLNLNDFRCSELLIWGNATFARVDYLMSFRTGMPIGSVCIASKSSGSLFDELPQVYDAFNGYFPLVIIKKILGRDINNLNDVIKNIEEIEKTKNFHYTIKAFGYFYNGNNLLFTNQYDLSLKAQYKKEQYSPPSLIKFDWEKHDWVHVALPR